MSHRECVAVYVCISYLLLCNKLSPKHTLKQTCTSSKFLWIRHLGALCWAPFLGTTHKAAIEVSLWQQGFQVPTERERVSKLTPVAVSSPLVLAGCWLGTSTPCHVGLSVGQLATRELSSLRGREGGGCS